MATLGLDIGGANIKAADDAGHAISRPFAIWRQPSQLPAEISAIVREFPRVDQIALTMTAELADCFSTKSEGVRFILDAAEASAGHAGIRVWATTGRFLSPAEARDFPLQVAAANWHALATWSAREIPIGTGLLVDIGTTTTDFIPIVRGRPAAAGLTDLHRLQSAELCYSGIRRTPLCAIAHSVPFRDSTCTLAAELFATTLDIHLLLRNIAEDASDLDTANGKPATRSAAHDRLARMLCCDRDELSLDEAVDIARFLADVQRQRLAGSLERVVHRLPTACEAVIIAGSGSFLAHQLVYENRHTEDAKVISLAQHLSPEIAEAACAHAIAQLCSSAT